MEPTCSQDARKQISTQSISISIPRKKGCTKTLPSLERQVHVVAERVFITQNCEWKKKKILFLIHFLKVHLLLWGKILFFRCMMHLSRLSLNELVVLYIHLGLETFTSEILLVLIEPVSSFSPSFVQTYNLVSVKNFS